MRDRRVAGLAWGRKLEVGAMIPEHIDNVPPPDGVPEARGFDVGRMLRVQTHDAIGRVARVVEVENDLVIADFDGALQSSRAIMPSISISWDVSYAAWLWWANAGAPKSAVAASAYVAASRRLVSAPHSGNG